MQDGILVGGPQDGARVTIGGGELPQRLYVGPRNLGDGFAAWSREACERFPAAYEDDGGAYVFRGWVVSDGEVRP